MKFACIVTAIIAAAFSVGCASKAADDPCERLLGLKLDKARVTSVDNVSGGKKFSFFGMFVGSPFFKVPPSCRVSLELTPTPDSLIKSEVWIPTKDWNGKLQGLGNGGLAGSIQKMILVATLQQGYAVAATDTGHEAKDDDGRWALNHPEKIRDYGSRAIHETTVIAKQLIKAYHGEGPKYSYFGSCSNGGRQGLMEAQRYPEDYDAIMAGAPAVNPSGGLLNWGWLQQQLAKPGAYISKDKISAIAAATLKACDASDGVTDGVIGEPQSCKFDPTVLLCAGKETDSCLTAPQIQGLKAIYSGMDGKHLGFMPGAELGGDLGWENWFSGSGPGKAKEIVFFEEYYRYLVSGDPSWSFKQFDLEVAREQLHKHLHEVLDAEDPDLSRFAARGGKLIMYHGWNDPALPPGVTINYYEKVRERMGKEEADKFVRLYMVPGLQHCFAGPGANTFGQLIANGETDPAKNINITLESWRESGRVPGPVAAVKYDYSNPLKSLFVPLDQAHVVFTRKLCVYPQVSRWDGKGDKNVESSYACVSP
ncbi:tannase/feruloyl esterase family alpha/beta hydrolase [Stenotrophobium rhamnosiphilum]|uniref:Tannase/feruloyl esterase family alpha/beta hydrolase n=1 Tax=Stenotrophobium rhamnosiphilum TaxID=2029166 RepID=A0A2T5MGY7_9GAMM|nr:tannase/feruloyl esterase family alpha/beta hydrolase [Stenotrophobium rhamnosiphilum]PTU31848.1 tannase/feruloyl esterase family alpha/beta hydrolase [Stenotrophobium rhamnosiphilum]